MIVAPLIFSASMSKALIRGWENPNASPHEASAKWWYGFHFAPLPKLEMLPYGEVNDAFWVRENVWQRLEHTEKMMRDGADTWPPFDDDANDFMSAETLKDWGWKRSSSIHMPRRASRITLELTGVRVEHLNDINEAHKTAEGATAERPFASIFESTMAPKYGPTTLALGLIVPGPPRQHGHVS